MRYWFVVGTQVADATVRLRLMTREIAALRDPGAREMRLKRLGESNPGFDVIERFGVLVNQTVATSEGHVFLWQGIDVTQGTSGEMTPLIRELADDSREFRTKLESTKGAAV